MLLTNDNKKKIKKKIKELLRIKLRIAVRLSRGSGVKREKNKLFNNVMYLT